MGIYDRDYFRDSPRSSFASLNVFSVTTWLIILNVAVFVLDIALNRMFPGTVEDAQNYYRQFGDGQYAVALARMSPLQRYGHFSMFLGVMHFQFWRFLTFQFLHASPGHLLGNMLSLYFFGQMVETYLSPRRYLVFYLLCGMAGAGLYLALLALPGIAGIGTPLVGASAGIFGVLIAAAFVAPNATIMLMFPPIPMQLRTFAWVMLGLAGFTVFTSGQNAGGEAAHLGGAALGFALIRFPQLLNWVVPTRRVPSMRIRRVPHKDWSQDFDR